MEEMLNKFYVEYERIYTEYWEAADTREAAEKNPKIYGVDGANYWHEVAKQRRAAFREAQKIGEIFGVNPDKMKEIEDRVIYKSLDIK